MMSCQGDDIHEGDAMYAEEGVELEARDDKDLHALEEGEIGDKKWMPGLHADEVVGLEAREGLPDLHAGEVEELEAEKGVPDLQTDEGVGLNTNGMHDFSTEEILIESPLCNALLDLEDHNQTSSSRDDREERLKKAYHAVLNGMSMYKAAKEFGISRTSLRRRIKKGSPNIPKSGGKPWISTSNENDLKEWCLKMMKIGCPVNKEKLRAVVKVILDKKKELCFPPDNMPSRRWVDRFLRRHPDLSYRIPESLGHLRARISYSDIQHFFIQLEYYLEKEYRLKASRFLTKENSNRIFNCDEVGFFLNATDRSSKVLVQKGIKNVYKRGGEGKLMMTVLFCMSAAGENIRPLIINKGKRLTTYEKCGGETDNQYSVASSDRGWMVGEVFYLWLVNIFNEELVKNNIKRPVILFLDGHSSHLTLETVNFARDHGIIMYSLLPHSSHILQPLDVAVFKPLKSKYRDVLDNCRGTLATHDLPKRHFPLVLMKAVNDSNMSLNAIKGFEATGLCPFNPSRIKADKILGEDNESNKQHDIVPVIVSTSNNTKVSCREIYEDIFKAGYKAALEDAQQRYEAALPMGVIYYYKTVTPAQSATQMQDSYFYGWRELTSRPIPPPERYKEYLKSLPIPQECGSSFLQQTQDQHATSHSEFIDTSEPSTSGIHTGPAQASATFSPLLNDIGSPEIENHTEENHAEELIPNLPLGVRDTESESARKMKCVMPPEHTKMSPFRKYLEIPESLLRANKGKIKHSNGPRLLTSEDNIKFQKEKRLKKISADEVREKKKIEREVMRARRRLVLKNAQPPKKRRKTKTPSPSPKEMNDKQTIENEEDTYDGNKCAHFQEETVQKKIVANEEQGKNEVKRDQQHLTSKHSQPPKRKRKTKTPSSSPKEMNDKQTIENEEDSTYDGNKCAHFQEETVQKKIVANEEQGKSEVMVDQQHLISKHSQPTKRRRKTKTFFDSSMEMVDKENVVSEKDIHVDNACGKCKRKSGAARKWIGCDNCQRWFHKECVDVSLELSMNEIENLSLICDKCAK